MSHVTYMNLRHEVLAGEEEPPRAIYFCLPDFEAMPVSDLRYLDEAFDAARRGLDALTAPNGTGQIAASTAKHLSDMLEMLAWEAGRARAGRDGR
ncbi:hypothetical protein [Xanthobacter sediminis]